MNQILNKYCLFILLIGLGLKAQSQSLKELISLALDKNYQLKISKNEAEIASNNNTLGNVGQLPSVGVNGSASSASNNARQEFSDGSIREGSNARSTNINASALLSWTIFDGFRVYANKDKLSFLESIGEENSKFYIEQTVADVVMVYHQLLYEHELLNNFKNTMKISSYRLNIEKRRKEIGSGKGIDYRQALVDYQTDSIRWLNQNNNIKLLEIELNRLINVELENEYNVLDTAFTIQALPSKEQLISNVDENNQQLKMQRLQELISEAEIRMQSADKYPTISLFAGYEYSESYTQVGFISANRNFGPAVGVRINFNLYNGGNTIREVKNARVESRIANLSREQLSQNLNADVLKLYYQHISMVERVQLAQENVTSMKVVYNIAAEQLSHGAISGYDFRLTQLILLNAELTLMQLRFNLKATEININRFSGTVLSTYF